ncbi:hypothetical protein AB0G04_28830 [Actinoplanes sp. NPDC023801]|uniref:hypothetical protein n=1 Tax=Actinoplanes sp. NPDC023801 TaxID=3154595 RepID=UPI0033F088CB
MSDEQLDRLVRDADPYRPHLVTGLDGAQQSLLEEIMSAPPLDSLPHRRPLRRRLAVAVAAAAVVTGLIGATVLLRPEPESPLVLPGIGASAGMGASPSAGTDTGGEGAGRRLDLKAAESYHRLLVEEPGWKLDTIYGFATAEGTASYSKDGATVEFNWSADEFYQGRYEDRLWVDFRPGRTTVAGQAGHLFHSNRWNHEVLLKPKDGSFVAIVGGGMTASRFDQLLDRVVRAGPEAFLASLPPEVVTPGKVREAATAILADVPLPPGFDVDDVEVGGANSPYQFNARVITKVSCQWLAEWERADRAGDDPAAETAAAALSGATGWQVLKDMEDGGGWSRQLWDLAADAAGGDYPEEYEDRLSCNR